MVDQKIWDQLKARLIPVIKSGFEIDSDAYIALPDAEKNMIVETKANQIVDFFYTRRTESFIEGIMKGRKLSC
jgi:hypothetical protein